MPNAYNDTMIRPATKRTIVMYWLFLLVPTILIGLAVFQLLGHEQERLQQQVRAASLDRARLIAETVQITVDNVRDRLAESLQTIPPDRLQQTLFDWQESNPLVRNVFIWRQNTGIAYPRPGQAATSEENRFIRRYDALFSGRLPWSAAAADAVAGGGTDTLAGASEARQVPNGSQADSALVEDIKRLKQGGRKLADRAEGRPKSATESIAGEKPYACGWIPWFMENRLYMLGWCQSNGTGLVYGIELELMTLLSQLVTDFPDSAPEGMVYGLVDGSGRILHQAGNGIPAADAAPDLAVSLAPHLPHWQMAVYIMDERLAGAAGGSFMLFGGLLLAIFIIAILAGGGLLTWQAMSHMKDARRKTSFVSNVSHELKTPLTSIRMYAELLHSGRVRDEGKKNRYLEVIVAESQRLTRLVNNVLDFSRLEQGRKKYHLETVELRSYLLQFVEDHGLRIQEAGMVIQKEMPDAQYVVRTDRDGLEQVLLNLVDNAIKYAAAGGELLFALERGNGRCCLKVMDRGSGVDPAHRRRIFEKFHRVDDSLTAAQPGSGLGLSIAGKILRDLNGDLLYEERPGGGSCFVVILPQGSIAKK